MSIEHNLDRILHSPVQNDDVSDIINQILPNGHEIHGYSSASNTRMLMIVERGTDYNRAPLLGFGMDGNAERALVRALATYIKREQEGIDYITEKQFPESLLGQIATGRHPSKFDHMVWDGHFKMLQDDQEVVATSSNGGGEIGFDPIEARAETPMGAVVALADQYAPFSSLRSVRERIKNLPPISLE